MGEVRPHQSVNHIKDINATVPPTTTDAGRKYDSQDPGRTAPWYLYTPRILQTKEMQMIEIPLSLRQTLEAGECILFLGAGIGEHLKDSDGRKAPNGKELTEELKSHFKIDSVLSSNLRKISQLIEHRHGREELDIFIRKRLSNLIPDNTFQWISNIKWKAIYTTNYDIGVQKAYDLTAKAPQTYVTITNTSEIANYDARIQVPIYHLHGSLFTSSESNIIITDDDYTKYKNRRHMMFELLKLHMATSSILYIGYANDDSTWNSILAEIMEEFYPNKIPQGFRVDPSTPESDIELLNYKNIETLKCSFQEFVDSAKVSLSLNYDHTYLQKYSSQIPSNLQNGFSKDPAATLRLLASWEYVNQTPVNVAANTKDFFRGDKPNWPLIFNKHYFERDIEEEIYEVIIDYATSMSNNPFVNIILASAGYGVTTLLMTLASRIVRDRACHVFFLKTGQSIIDGDIEFALNLFPEDKIIFIVDNCAEHSDTINTIIHNYRQTNKSVMFLIGERTNEWKQSNTKLKGSIYSISPLSDGEINRLIDCLGTHCELNKLDNLERTLQFSAIKKNYNRELLVAIREATEGKSFDAIIDDEFRGIKDDISRDIYLAVCCFHQLGVFARVQLIANLFNIGQMPELLKICHP
jgi:hypothetical protein